MSGIPIPSILTEVGGVIHFKDMIENVTMKEQLDEITGYSQWVVTESPDEKKLPRSSSGMVRDAARLRRTLCPRTPT